MDVFRNKKSEANHTIALTFIISVAIRFLLSNFAKVMYDYPDELRYYDIAKSLYYSAGISIRGVTSNYQKIGISLLFTPLFAIKNPVIRVKFISALQCALMSSSIFPISKICNELKLTDRQIYKISVLFIIFPDMMYTVSFMSEPLFWALCLWFVFLWLHSRNTPKISYGIIMGLLAYMGYLCKEFMLVTIVTVCICGLGDLYRKKKSAFGRLKVDVITVGIFVICHIMVKSLVFTGLGNSYNQTGIGALNSAYSWIYLIYSAAYFISAILLACLIFPIVYPLCSLKNMKSECTRLFQFLCVYFIVAAGTVAYTISVREDLGQLFPRPHLRYVGQCIFLLFPIFIKTVDDSENIESDDLTRKRFGGTLCLFVAFVCLVFKGSERGLLDQFVLRWYSVVQRIPGGYAYVVIVGLMICAASFILHRWYITGRKSLFVNAFIVMLVALAFVSNLVSYVKMWEYYGTERQKIDFVCELAERAESDDESILYIGDINNAQNKLVKYWDTYFDYTDRIEYVDVGEIDAMKQDSYNVRIVEENGDWKIIE